MWVVFLAVLILELVENDLQYLLWTIECHVMMFLYFLIKGTHHVKYVLAQLLENKYYVPQLHHQSRGYFVMCTP